MSHPTDEIAVALEDARADTRGHPGKVTVELTLTLSDDAWTLTGTEVLCWEPQTA